MLQIYGNAQLAARKSSNSTVFIARPLMMKDALGTLQNVRSSSPYTEVE